MQRTAYRAIDAYRRQSVLLTALSAALIVALFAGSVWILGYDDTRPLGLMASGFVGALFASRDFVVALLRARPLTAAEAPRLYQRLDALSIVFGLRALPDVYVVRGATPNALSLDRVGARGALVLTRAALELSDDELDAVLAHELSHLAASVAGLRVVTALIGAALSALASPRTAFHAVAIGAVIALSVLLLGPAPLYFVFLLFVFLVADARISRRREDVADAQAVLATRYPVGLLRVIQRGASPERAGADALTGDAARVAAPLWMIRPAHRRGWVETALDAHPSDAHRLRHVEAMS